MGTERGIVRRLRHEDDGFALLLVVAIGMIISMLVVVAFAASRSALTSSAQHQNFENSLAAAEAGLDQTLGLISYYKNQTPSVDYVTPASCGVSSLPAASTFTSATAERTWAKSVILGLPSSCTQTTSAGQFVAFHPPGRNVVYSMGWAPSRSSTIARPRLLKAEYIFAPFKPSKALLTAGNIDFGGNVSVSALAGLGSNIHTNGSVTQLPVSVSVAGSLSAVGTTTCTSSITGGCTSAVTPESVPDAAPRVVYTSFNSSTASSGWADLCPDGTARTPSTSGPCQGPVVSSGTEAGGWTFKVSFGVPTWTLDPASAPYPAADTVYYGYGVNMVLDGTGGNPGVYLPYTILDEGVPSTDPLVSAYASAAICGLVGGDVTVKQTSIVPSSLTAGLSIMATGDVNLSTQTQVGVVGNGGLVLAGNDLTTIASASTTIVGALIANNTCTQSGRGTNDVQGWNITYDRSAEVPVTSIINTTLWLEYPG